jgi:predicted NAD/FAD-binding protein
VRIAIIGSGIAGMTAAHLLHRDHDVHLFEADDRPGGHANTVHLHLDGREVAADTGFLVYNERTYPRFTRLLAQLGVVTQRSDMSFSLTDRVSGLEWRGTSLGTVFAQRRNAVRPRFLAMLADVARFNRLARRLLEDPTAPAGTLADLLAGHRWSQGFFDWYLVPMGSAVWSADPTTFTRIPARTFAEFFGRHGLLRFGDQPEWRTVTGGSSRYVEAIVAPLRHRGRLHLATSITKVRREAGRVELLTDTGPSAFDHVILAVHSDQALGLLSDPTGEERATLGAIRYQQNRATLHTDTRLLPVNQRAWAAWNYLRPPERTHQATLTYYLNRLQGLDLARPLLVTLNRDEEIEPDLVLRRFDYAHPVIDQPAVSAQSRQKALSRGDVSYCGAYWGYGFHEDGVNSAVAVCERFGVTL